MVHSSLYHQDLTRKQTCIGHQKTLITIMIYVKLEVLFENHPVSWNEVKYPGNCSRYKVWIEDKSVSNVFNLSGNLTTLHHNWAADSIDL